MFRRGLNVLYGGVNVFLRVLQRGVTGRVRRLDGKGVQARPHVLLLRVRFRDMLALPEYRDTSLMRNCPPL